MRSGPGEANCRQYAKIWPHVRLSCKFGRIAPPPPPPPPRQKGSSPSVAILDLWNGYFNSPGFFRAESSMSCRPFAEPATQAQDSQARDAEADHLDGLVEQGLEAPTAVSTARRSGTGTHRARYARLSAETAVPHEFPRNPDIAARRLHISSQAPRTPRLLDPRRIPSCPPPKIA